MGEQYVVVLGHPTYYPRFGFGRASAHAIHVSIEVPDEALMAMSLAWQSAARRPGPLRRTLRDLTGVEEAMPRHEPRTAVRQVG